MAEELGQIEFLLHDKVKGQELTLANVDLPTLRRFLEDVEELVEGDGRKKVWLESCVSIETGSIKVIPLLLAAVLSNLNADLSKVERTGDLDLISVRRAKRLSTNDAWRVV